MRSEVQNNLDDPNGTYLDSDFLDPKIQTVYERFTSELTGTNSQYDIDVVDVSNLPPGTPNLASYQIVGQPLYQLVNPTRIDWKPAGLADAYYQLLEGPKDVNPDLIPQNYMVCWEFRKYIVWLSAATINVDLRIRGEYDPNALTQDDSLLTLHPRIGYAVACQVSSDVAKTRGNASWKKDYGDDADNAMDFIGTQLVKSTQGIIRRAGRQTGRSGGFVGPNSMPQ